MGSTTGNWRLAVGRELLTPCTLGIIGFLAWIGPR